MGLDMWAFAVPKGVVEIAATDVKFDDETEKAQEELACWRKHHDLHGWMEKLYNEKGGKALSFNCVTVQLKEEDLNRLEEDVKSNQLPQTTGFFFGNNPPNDDTIEEDLEFVEKAREAIKEGKAVFYNSWW